ncbi:hypothetical protein PM023_16110 [Halorubrum ezzemoulense]|uniref:hypothetical protein n=1 Tax=Halorubrum ezzemoulense TaxID=337243 RepID=UPI00232EE3CD|nr:hypothetical protein [Halorubrum ezzemoulense]MDB2226171.1 hypothetical protein [Halorubrum ezzemoulense]
MSDEDGRPTVRDVLLAAVGGGKGDASAERGRVGSTDPPKEVRLPYDAAERVYVKHDGEWYELVETDDGLSVVEADE